MQTDSGAIVVCASIWIGGSVVSTGSCLVEETATICVSAFCSAWQHIFASCGRFSNSASGADITSLVQCDEERASAPSWSVRAAAVLCCAVGQQACSDLSGWLQLQMIPAQGCVVK